MPYYEIPAGACGMVHCLVAEGGCGRVFHAYFMDGLAAGTRVIECAHCKREVAVVERIVSWRAGDCLQDRCRERFLFERSWRASR